MKGITQRWLVALCGVALLAVPPLSPGVALGGPSAGDTLVFARQEETETLDPHKISAISSAEVDYLLYDTLTTLDYDKTVKPGLAEKWVISPDGKTYTFALRPGASSRSSSSTSPATRRASSIRRSYNTRPVGGFAMIL